MDPADLSLLTSGFSRVLVGLGILLTQGVSGEGGAMIGDSGGPEMIPAATCWISLSHLSHRFMFTGGLSDSGVVMGLPGAGRDLLVRGSIMAEVPTSRVDTFSPTLASLVLVSAWVMVLLRSTWRV